MQMARSRKIVVFTDGLARLGVPHADLSLISPWFYTASWGPYYTPSVCFFRFSGSLALPGPLSGRKMMRENMWREFFSDPTQWWDHRSEKVNPRYPDFKHKKTQQALWLIDNLTPAWVESELGAMAPGLLQSHIFSWHLRLRRHVKAGDYRKTLYLYQQMQREGVIVDKFTFVSVLSACANLRSLEEGRSVHQQIIERDCESDVYVANCLIDMYAKCGSIEDAWVVFKNMREHDVVSWSAMIGGYVNCGQGLKAMELFRHMYQEGVEPDAITFVGVLKACTSLAALEEGRHVHEQIIQRGFQFDVYVANCLLDMYAKCGSIEDAWEVFSKMRHHNVVSWSAIIRGYVKSGQGLKALELFRRMQQEGVEPDAVTFVGVLNACASLVAFEEGRRVHEQIIRRGCESDVYIGNSLVDMYAKCGSIGDAWSVFNKMKERNVVSWSAMIGGYVKSGQGLKAMELFRKMRQEGVEPNAVTFVGLVNACTSRGALEEGRRCHKQIIQGDFESDVHVANCLVDMYAKCGDIEDAWRVFNKIGSHNVVSWSAMIGGYVKSGQGLKSMELFRKMEQEGVEPDTVTFVGMLNACASVGALDEGRRIHKQIIQRGYEADGYIATCLVDMYAKCGSIEDAWSVFNKIREHDIVSWNAMIGGYVKSGQGLKAMDLFGKMQQEGVEPDTVTFVALLNACASVLALEEGRGVHQQIIQRGCECDVYIATCLVDMYAKCGGIEDAWTVFNKMQKHDLVSWNAMIGAYVKSGQGLEAMQLFEKMQKEGVEPDAVTFVGVLNACASEMALEAGKHIHDQINETGCQSDVFVATCLVDMYAKCGSIEDACIVFNKMAERDLVSWNAMIRGYVKSDQGLKAIELFREMQLEGVEPDAVTFVGVLSACASVASFEEGRRVHEQIIQRGCESDVYVATCLVDMYAQSGSIDDALSVFNKMGDRDVVSWNAMIGGCAIHGHAKKAIGLFKQMGIEGAEMNEITFTSLLSACSHGGLLKEGVRYFKSMTSCYDILPNMEHMACMVDLLGRAGQLEEAEKIALRSPMEGDAPMWMSLLSACRNHGNIRMAERAAKRCSELEPESASGHVLLSNIYAAF